MFCNTLFSVTAQNPFGKHPKFRHCGPRAAIPCGDCGGLRVKPAMTEGVLNKYGYINIKELNSEYQAKGKTSIKQILQHIVRQGHTKNGWPKKTLLVADAPSIRF